MDATECSEETHAGATHRRRHTHIYFHQPPHLEIIIHSDAISLWIKGSNMSPKPVIFQRFIRTDERVKEPEAATGENRYQQDFAFFLPFSLLFLSPTHPPPSSPYYDIVSNSNECTRSREIAMEREATSGN